VEPSCCGKGWAGGRGAGKVTTTEKGKPATAQEASRQAKRKFMQVIKSRGDVLLNWDQNAENGQVADRSERALDSTEGKKDF